MSQETVISNPGPGTRNPKPSFIIAGTSSGCGKTTLTLALMAALKRRGLRVRPFKCGPDFIDPTLHRQVTGEVSRNLDVRMCGEEFVRASLARHGADGDICVIEGVMGLFDGGRGSAAHLAALLGIPVILVVDVRSAAESVAAVVRGFESLRSDVRVAGVIFNRVGSARHARLIRGAVEEYCQARILGAMPRDAHISMPSRHLGLHMGSEMQLNIERMVSLVEEHLDLDLLLRLAQYRAEQDKEKIPQPGTRNPQPSSVRLGLAWDEAFCFYYQDNLDMLRLAGAELVVFSPLHDRELPAGLDGIYLGGGYPELHAARLAANTDMRQAMYDFASSGRPVYGECGGFMYLCRAIQDQEGQEHEMAGIFPVRARMGTRLRRLGYRRVELAADCLLGQAGTFCYGHEFHYSEIEAMPDGIERIYLLDDGRGEGYRPAGTNVLAGYVHLHWGRTPEAAQAFVRAMQTINEETS